MSPEIISVFRANPNNVGDYNSSPVDYFEFSGFSVTKLDIEHVLSWGETDFSGKHILFGGGGLLTDYYLGAFDHIRGMKTRGKLIGWGIGQQVHKGARGLPWWVAFKHFPYDRYLAQFDLLGIRDVGFAEDYVPCASCMHKEFDVPRTVEHKYVAFSHIWYPLPLSGIPTMTHTSGSMKDTLDFLGSAETVLTSSYHGMYWAALLGRKVVSFPTNSKFFTFKYPVLHYPAVWRRSTSVSRSAKILLGKSVSRFELESVEGWKLVSAGAHSFSNSLQESRLENAKMYKRMCQLLGQGKPASVQ